MRLLAAVLAASALAVTLTLIATRQEAGAAPQQRDIVLRLGDRVRVEGHPIGCQVATQQGRTYLDCRRAGPLKGTYGTLLNERRAMVVHFRSNTIAKVVFTATQRGAARRCH